MRAPIHSQKHYVQKSLNTITAGIVDSTVIVDAEAAGAVSGANEVIEGALVKAIFVEMWVRSQEASPGAFVGIICKHPGGVNNPTAAEMAALNDWDNKKNILYTTQGLTNDGASITMPMLKDWLKIPKGKQRMGLGDSWRMHLFAQALDLNNCGFFTYKEYT